MTRGKEHYQQNILDESPVLVFSAGSIPMMDYEYIIGHPEQSSPTVAKKSEMYILDSGIDGDFTTDEVIERALHLNADITVPVDVLSDTEQTTTNVVTMARRLKDKDISMIVPLQKDSRLDRCEHYDELAEKLSAIGVAIDDMWIGVGGIRDKSITEQILTVKRVREHVGNDVHLHAFGCGMAKDWIVAIRQMPNIVDSIDSSLIVRAVVNGKVINTDMEQIDIGVPRGKNSTCMKARFMDTQLYMINYLLGDFVDERDVPNKFTDEKLGCDE